MPVKYPVFQTPPAVQQGTPESFRRAHPMMKLSIFLGMFVVSTAAGLAADALGCDFFTSFLISGVGGMVGCWAGWAGHRRDF